MKKPSLSIVQFSLENSLFLVLGAVFGLLWANLHHDSYEQLRHLELFESSLFGNHRTGLRVVDLHFVVNDILMTFFFAIAGKEVWEARLPGGPLAQPAKAVTPLVATLGGMVGPASIYLAGALIQGKFSEYSNGWAIPCATDIAFSYMVARFIFGEGHPAIPFLLLLAIADDALGLIILAVFYPQEEVRAVWLLLPALAVAAGLLFRRLGVKSFWWYVLVPGVTSWTGFALAGLHPALGLLPVIPTMPHAHTDLGLFMARELERRDTLNEFAHWWDHPVEVILGLFGLLNAGVVLTSVGEPTVLVLLGLLIGKPLGIVLGGWIAAKWLGFGLPDGIDYRTLFVLSLTAAIGFTVALFVSVVAFPAGANQDAAKMGALLSLGAAILAIGSSRLLGIRRTG